MIRLKKYPEFQLGPLNLELEPGTVLGYIGPNGSGNSTTLHCLVGLEKTDDGHCCVLSDSNNSRLFKVFDGDIPEFPGNDRNHSFHLYGISHEP